MRFVRVALASLALFAGGIAATKAPFEPEWTVALDGARAQIADFAIASYHRRVDHRLRASLLPSWLNAAGSHRNELQQVLGVVTAAGKLVAFDAATGARKWEAAGDFAGARIVAPGAGFSAAHAFFAIQGATARFLCADSGTVTKQSALPVDADAVRSVSFLASLVILGLKTGEVKAVSLGQTMAAAVAERFVWARTQNTLNGFKVRSDGTVHRAWSQALPPNHVIHSVVQDIDANPNANSAILLNDKSLLYKQSFAAHGLLLVISSDAEDAETFHVAAVDAVTGAILYHGSQAACLDPAGVNGWVAGSEAGYAWAARDDDGPLRYAATLGFLHSAVRDDPSYTHTMKDAVSERIAASNAREVATRVVILPPTLAAAGHALSVTASGITPKALYSLRRDGALLAYALRAISPYLVAVSGAAPALTMAVPKIIGVAPLSGDAAVIRCTASSYESTTDIYVVGSSTIARFALSPAGKKFDRLDPSFSKSPLLLTLLILVAGTLYVKRMRKEQKFKHAWL